ncbi:MAG: HD domain-containing phosphohydrolase [Mycobacterium leprae]
MSLTSEALRLRNSGTLLLQRRLFLAARDLFSQWLSLVEASGDPALVIPALNALTAVACCRGDLEAASSYLNTALPLTADPSAPSRCVSQVYLNLVKVYTDMGRLADALQFAERAAHRLADADPFLNKTYWLHLSNLHWRRHEWTEALNSSDRAYALSEATGDRSAAAMALVNRGIAQLELGYYQEAEEDLTLAQKTGLREGAAQAYAHAELGRLHFIQGDGSKALACGREALDTLLTGTAVLDKEEVARVSRLFGTILAQAGQRNLALKYLNRAAAYFSQLGLSTEWRRCTDAIAQALAMPPQAGRTELFREIHRLDFLTAVLDLTDDLECVDPYLRRRAERVALLATILGEEVGLPKGELVTLNHAARLADVGMVAVEAELLHREGELSAPELSRVAAHASIGEEMVRPYGLEPLGLAAIRHHHERYDGLGYPDGLEGEAIPPLARIIALADCYDAMTSDRNYRKALSHARAMEELRAMAGKKLDPTLVDRFEHLHAV